jgi:hypothetical protein
MSFGKMTLEELEEYREKWKSWNSKDFDANLVVEIYKNELNVATSSQRVRVLEISQYLENYLWPRFDAETASLEHVMSIVLMVNEKFRENVPAWACFHEREEVFQACAVVEGGEGAARDDHTGEDELSAVYDSLFPEPGR